LRKITASSGREIRSRNIYHSHNALATQLLVEELQAIGGGRLMVRLHRFTQDGRKLYNVEAELPGNSPEIVLVTAHLDSTAIETSPYHSESDQAPGVDDDGSGMAAVVSIAERLVALARDRPPARTIRFVLFNAEEYGFVGSTVYARQQRLAGAQIVAVFQLDMVGFKSSPPRTWEIHAGYNIVTEVERSSVRLAELAGRLTPLVSPDLETPQIYTSQLPDGDPAQGRSDHGPFHDRGYAAVVASEDFFVGPASDSPATMASSVAAPPEIFIAWALEHPPLPVGPADQILRCNRQQYVGDRADEQQGRHDQCGRDRRVAELDPRVINCRLVPLDRGLVLRDQCFFRIEALARRNFLKRERA
jgi:Zn-dependent M28 family amino/carboxypeptidase